MVTNLITFLQMRNQRRKSENAIDIDYLKQEISQNLIAHKKAPIDYISPWDAQHHKNFAYYLYSES